MKNVYVVIVFLIFGAMNIGQAQFKNASKQEKADAEIGMEMNKDASMKTTEESNKEYMKNRAKFIKDSKKNNIPRPKKTMSKEDQRQREQRAKSMENREKINKLKEVRRDKLENKLAESKKALKDGKARLDKLVSKIDKDKSSGKLSEEAYASKLELIKIVETNLSDLQIKMDRAAQLIESN